MRNPLPCILISGATASGKSSLATAIASRCRGEIVNIDSVQCFSGVAIGAATPTTEERGTIPHHLFECFPPSFAIDAVLFRDHVITVVTDILNRGNIPILVGCSGMYIRVLYSGIAQLPPVPDSMRSDIRFTSLDVLYKQLTELDPKRAAELHPRDRARIERAVEICLITGGPVAAAYKQGQDAAVQGMMFIVQREREELRERIRQRTELMITDGIIDETKALLKTYGDKISVLKTIGFRQVHQALTNGEDGELEKLKESIVIATSRYAKRQRTFWRNEPEKCGWEQMMLVPSGVKPVESFATSCTSVPEDQSWSDEETLVGSVVSLIETNQWQLSNAVVTYLPINL